MSVENGLSKARDERENSDSIPGRRSSGTSVATRLNRCLALRRTASRWLLHEKRSKFESGASAARFARFGARGVVAALSPHHSLISLTSVDRRRPAVVSRKAIRRYTAQTEADGLDRLCASPQCAVCTVAEHIAKRAARSRGNGRRHFGPRWRARQTFFLHFFSAVTHQTR